MWDNRGLWKSLFAIVNIESGIKTKTPAYLEHWPTRKPQVIPSLSSSQVSKSAVISQCRRWAAVFSSPRGGSLSSQVSNLPTIMSHWASKNTNRCPQCINVSSILELMFLSDSQWQEMISSHTKSQLRAQCQTWFSHFLNNLIIVKGPMMYLTFPETLLS